MLTRTTVRLQVRNVIRQIRLTAIDILNFILDVRRDYRIALALAAFRELYDSYETSATAIYVDDDSDDHGELDVGWPNSCFEQVSGFITNSIIAACSGGQRRSDESARRD